jgi:cyclopropane fatty-acyl-phospholipid synthase-like methyltransferase
MFAGVLGYLQRVRVKPNPQANIDMSMEQTSIARLDRICQKLQLDENDHVLEIGTGWAGFAIHAAKNYGCKVSTTTISQQQSQPSLRVMEGSLTKFHNRQVEGSKKSYVRAGRP